MKTKPFTLSTPGNRTALAILPEGIQRTGVAERKLQTRKLRFTQSPVLRSHTNVFSHALFLLRSGCADPAPARSRLGGPETARRGGYRPPFGRPPPPRYRTRPLCRADSESEVPPSAPKPCLPIFLFRFPANLTQVTRRRTTRIRPRSPPFPHLLVPNEAMLPAVRAWEWDLRPWALGLPAVPTVPSSFVLRGRSTGQLPALTSSWPLVVAVVRN